MANLYLVTGATWSSRKYNYTKIIAERVPCARPSFAVRSDTAFPIA